MKAKVPVSMITYIERQRLFVVRILGIRRERERNAPLVLDYFDSRWFAVCSRVFVTGCYTEENRVCSILNPCRLSFFVDVSLTVSTNPTYA